jgi:His-Xaa-Ser system protein HxsD
MKFSKELYSKVALIKAAYNYTDIAYVHLDADADYYYVLLTPKNSTTLINEQNFANEMLAQSVRHEVYQQTKNIRELLLARAMSTSLVVDEEMLNDCESSNSFSESDILKDWFENNEGNSI